MDKFSTLNKVSLVYVFLECSTKVVLDLFSGALVQFFSTERIKIFTYYILVGFINNTELAGSTKR